MFVSDMLQLLMSREEPTHRVASMLMQSVLTAMSLNATLPFGLHISKCRVVNPNK